MLPGTKENFIIFLLCVAIHHFRLTVACAFDRKSQTFYMDLSKKERSLTPGADQKKPLITGASMIPFKRYQDGSNFRDWVRTVSNEALKEAELEHHEVEAVIVANESDLLSLQISPAALVVDEIGLHYASAVHVEAGGASGAAAIHQGFVLIGSGYARNVLVVGFEQTASRLNRSGVQQVYSLSFDADLEGWAGASTAALYALSYQAYCNEYGCDPALAAGVSVKNHGNAIHNAYAHKPMDISVADVLASEIVSDPYRLLDCSMVSDGAAALVLSNSSQQTRTGPKVKITGSACSTDYVRLGDRQQTHWFAAKHRAAQIAYAMAGITSPDRQIDVAEVYDAFSGAEFQAIEALGLCPPGEAGMQFQSDRFSVNGSLPINLSGGLIGQGGAPGATGIAQAITLYRLLSNDYFAELQPRQSLRRGVADAHSGIATTNIVHVLQRIDD